MYTLTKVHSEETTINHSNGYGLPMTLKSTFPEKYNNNEKDDSRNSIQDIINLPKITRKLLAME